MLTDVALLAALGAAVLAFRWLTARTDALGRPRAFPVYAVGGLAVVAVLCAVPVVRHDRLESRLSRVASALVGHAVHVHCQTAGEEFVDAGAELGFVRYDARGVPEPRALIKREQCGLLRSYLSHHGRDASLAQLVAVHVLTHEAMHMRGLTSEAQAECAAVQRDASTATLLGASPPLAHALAQRYFGVVYPDLPDDYRSSECAAGASWDERLASPPW